MKLTISLSTVPDGPVTRVLAVAYDLQGDTGAGPLWAHSWDSNLPRPEHPALMPEYVEKLLRHAAATIHIDCAPDPSKESTDPPADVLHAMRRRGLTEVPRQQEGRF